MLFHSLPLLSLLALAPAALASPPAFSSCTLGANDCPAQSICTPTSTCGGVCFTPSPVPPVTRCTVGGPYTPCGTSAICTQTENCPSPNATPCGGQCLYTGPATQSIGQPTKPCVIGGDQCADQAPGVFCTQTQVCRGLCIATPSSATATRTTITTPPPTTPTPRPCKCGKDCKKGEKCIVKNGRECKLGGAKCDGYCVKA